MGGGQPGLHRRESGLRRPRRPLDTKPKPGRRELASWSLRQSRAWLPRAGGAQKLIDFPSTAMAASPIASESVG